MVDAEGRHALTSLLADLPSAMGMTVVHVTHRREEIAAADRSIPLVAAASWSVRDGPRPGRHPQR